MQTRSIQAHDTPTTIATTSRTQTAATRARRREASRIADRRIDSALIKERQAVAATSIAAAIRRFAEEQPAQLYRGGA